MEQTATAPQFGRKIFFLSPTFLIRTSIIDVLREKEYEVYDIADNSHAGDYLTLQEDAILYINPGTRSSPTLWLNLINTLKEEYPQATIGIVSEQMNETLSQQLSLCNAIEGGIFEVEADVEQTLTQLMQQLDSIGAKGRRQYVRASCKDDQSASLMWFHGTKLFKTRLLDISVASAAVIIESEKLQFIDTTASMPCTLQLGANQIQVMVKPLVVKQQNERFHCIIYLLNRESMKPEVVGTVRKYVVDTLKRQLQQQIEALRQRQILKHRMEIARKQRLNVDS